MRDLKQWYKSHSKQILEDYFTFLKHPSISTDPAYRKQVHETAEWVANYLKGLGLNTQLWKTSVHPVVFASQISDRSKPTLLIYHHYDVQPVDPLELWKSPPFEPEVRDGQVYARGASDNKGQCFATLTALKALFDLGKKIGFNLKLFIEGEEECGSRGTIEVLKTKKEELKADYLLVVDSGLPARNTPGITIGLRGIVELEVRCKNSKIDLHSGVHGGIALNPNRALIQLLAQLWDQNGKITVPGFYDNVKPVSKPDHDVDRAYLQKQFGIQAFQGEGGYTLLESNTTRPTLEINGISGGYTGEGFKTVIPAMAKAKISCRLVADQDPDTIAQLVASHLKKIAPPGLTIEVDLDHGGKPVCTSPTTKIAQICSKAYAEVFKQPCQNILFGGSIPLVAELVHATGAEPAIIGVSLDSDDIHAPNEHFGLDQLEQGFLTMATILEMSQ